MTILAIDQGTTSTRALAVEPDGRASMVAAIRHQQFYPQPGWVEHDPEELMRNVETCLLAIGGIRAVGIDNQGESCLAWHADTGEPIGRVIVWQDDRTGDEVRKLAADGVESEITARSGLPLDSYFSATKLAWILDHDAEAARLHRKGKLRLGTTDAFFLQRLTGRCITDITTASRTALMNLETGQWDEELCRLFRVPMDTLPQIVPTTGELGSLSVAGSPIPVTASVVDQQAALYGHGCRQSGDAKITFGTGAFALLVTGDSALRAPDQGLLPTVAWRHTGDSPVFALDGGVYCAGSAIEWARGLGMFSDYEEINAFSEPAAIDSDLAFVPALSGLACPHWDRRAAGAWIGLSLDTTKTDMAQALLEGIAFRASEVIEAMARLTPMGQVVSIDGGVSANPYFCQFLADVLGRQVTIPSFAELTAIGTAQLAGARDIREQDPGTTREYSPERDLGDQCARFADAVSRTRAWRQRATAD